MKDPEGRAVSLTESENSLLTFILYIYPGNTLTSFMSRFLRKEPGKFGGSIFEAFPSTAFQASNINKPKISF